MRSAFHRECLLKSQATLAFVGFTTFLWCSLLSITLTVWLLLAFYPSSSVTCCTEASGTRLSRQDCSSPSFQSSTFQRDWTYCSLKFLPVPQAELPAIMLQLDGSPPLGGDRRGVIPFLLVAPLLGLLEGRDLPLPGCHKVLGSSSCMV